MQRKIRNLGIIAHVDAGKTTLSERVLLYTGRIRKVGEVHEGASRLDHDTSEQAHGITITAAAVTCPWDDHQINLIDTPGHVDFTIEVERSLRVLDGAVCVFDAVAGVEAQTETVWKQADDHQVPRLCFVNKLDRLDANFDSVVAQIASALAARPVVVNAPIGSEQDLAGVLDIIAMKAIVWERGSDGRDFVVRELEPEEKARALVYREILLDVCSEFDDSILEDLLEGDHVTSEKIIAALRRATLANAITPVLGGSAYRNIGVQPLLDAVIRFLPAPADGAELVDTEDRGTRERTAAEPLTALCFKVVHDRHGQTSFVRVYSGVLRKGDKIETARDGRSVRIARLVRLFAEAREEVAELAAGDIGAIVGPTLGSGDTLHSAGDPFALESIRSPEALVEVAIEAATSRDDEKLGRALARMAQSDPSLRVFTDDETGQRRLAGMGQLHLEMALEKLTAEYEVDARMGPPQVAYRQTVTKTVDHQFTLKKQTGGPGMYAKVTLRIGPADRGDGLLFVDKTSGGVIPKEYVRGVRAGIASAMELGSRGIPAVDLAVELLDGDTHSKDSSEMAFRIAAQRAVSDILERETMTVVLEPVVTLEVEIAVENAGAIVGDIGKRRGRVNSIGNDNQRSVVQAVVPLAETFGYAGSLSAKTSGRGRFRFQPAGYEPV